MSTRREFLSQLAVGAAATTGTFATLGSAAHAAAPSPSGGSSSGGWPGLTVLYNATLIDGTDAPPRRDAVIVIAGEKIVAVGGRPDLPGLVSGIDVVDVGGRYVLPGLWDMHTHGSWLVDTFLPLHVANGVTGIREMVGPPGMDEIRDLLDSGALLGPRMVLASRLVDGPHSLWGDEEGGVGVIEARTPDEARAAVRQAHDEGADFVKVYSFLFPDVFAAAAEEANQLGIEFAGHVPIQVPVGDAIELGQHTMEHQYGLVLSSSTDRRRLYRELERVFAKEDPDRWGQAWWETQLDAIDSHDPGLAGQLFRQMAERGTWASPTLAVERTGTVPAEEILDDERMMDLLERYIHPSMREEWLQRVQGRLDRPPEEIARHRDLYELQAEMIGPMADAGVRFVAGTDCWIPFLFPGFSLADELELLVSHGLTAQQALRSATSDAARCVGWGDVSGTVEAGKLADLVITEKNPLDDIANIRQVHSVVSRGRYISPREREKILADAEAAAQEEPEWGSATPSLRSGAGLCC